MPTDSHTRTTINPRFAAYAAAHGNTPAQQIDADRVLWPGGKMAGFLLWSKQKWREFDKLDGHKASNDAFRDTADHARFDEWLAKGCLHEPNHEEAPGSAPVP